MMKSMNRFGIFLLTAFLLSLLSSCKKAETPPVKQSYFKLTTSNGLIVSVYNAAENRIDYVYPHIFANIDSAHYVHPFVGNIRLSSDEKPVKTAYLANTHVIECKYKDFTVYYMASFTRQNKVFYVVARGDKQSVENLSFTAETGEGNAVSGITMLENPLEDLPCRIEGKAISGSLLKEYDGFAEKYFLYSFTDSLHTDSLVVKKELEYLAAAKTSLVDDEEAYMKGVFKSCNFPAGLTDEERNAAEQSVSMLKMSQVATNEIFPLSHGQILASLRPGLWHIAWVRDGSFAIQAMTRAGLKAEARAGLEFMLRANANRFRNYVYKNGVDYGPGVDYRISLTRYFGNGTEECDYNEFGPNIEFDDFGLFLTAFSDYVLRTGDEAFYREWEQVVSKEVADAIIACMDTNNLIKADSGPWEHHLQQVKQYTFTSAVCARGLELYAELRQKMNDEPRKYKDEAAAIKNALMRQMLIGGRYFKGNATDNNPADHEYYDAGAFELFANGLITDKDLFASHLQEYDKVLRISGDRPGYIRLQGNDPYENQEWVFIDLRIAMAYLLNGDKEKASGFIDFVTRQAAANYNTIPEMYSNRLQREKVSGDPESYNIWCNCVREGDDEYIGTIPMIGYGSGAYLLSLLEYYNR
jgi:GH15 family glucan-1,4-alpha-glucosidase